MSTAFETEMSVMPEIAKAVEEMEWNLPTDIQSEAVPLILGGCDVLMAAETGSGKTGAFCLPILQIVYETIKSDEKNKTNENKSVKVLHVNQKWCMNAYDRSESMAISTDDGLLCQSRDQYGWHGSRATRGVHKGGKHYFEATVTDDGLCRIGWATGDATLELGVCPFGYGFGGTGKKSNCKKFDTYGESFTLGDVIGNCLDLDKGEIKWTKNGKDYGKAYDIAKSQLQDVFYPAICLKNAELRMQFMKNGLKYLLSGYTACSESDMKFQYASPKSINNSAKKVNLSSNTSKRQGPLAVIVEPSIELAEQTFRQLCLFKKYVVDPEIRVVLLVGGQNIREQREKLQNGVEIVVGTPGRLLDMVSSNEILCMRHVRFLVFDEADGLLQQGHKSILESLHNGVGDKNSLQMIVCSATLHSFDVKRLANQMMRFPQWVDLRGKDSVPETVHHVVCWADPLENDRWKQHNSIDDGVHSNITNIRNNNNKSNLNNPESLSLATKLLKPFYVVEAIEKLNIDKSLIFCRTKLDCDNLEKMFTKLGGGPGSGGKQSHKFSCVCLHGDRNPAERKANLMRFKQNEVHHLICTDVAARGIDIHGLPYVINVTLPDEKENYLHRIGRVGRAERMGLAISLVGKHKEKVWYHSNCTDRGRFCRNTDLTDNGGCCIWYNETQLLGDIEEHLGCTIDSLNPRNIVIPTNEFDGKVVYGAKLQNNCMKIESRADILAPSVRALAELENQCQNSYLKYIQYKY